MLLQREVRSRDVFRRIYLFYVVEVQPANETYLSIPIEAARGGWLTEMPLTY